MQGRSERVRARKAQDTTCGQFSSCRSSRTAQGLKANCECHEHFERDAEGRCAADQKFFRCCASQGEPEA